MTNPGPSFFWTGARRAAAELELTLNDGKTARLDLEEPFDFLGFRFERRGRWQTSSAGRPVRVEELGWRDASARRPAPATVRLPGECDIVNDGGSTLIAGPGTYSVQLDAGRISLSDAGRPVAPPTALERLDSVVLLGEPVVSGAVLRELAGRGIALFVADERGNWTASLCEDAEGSAAAAAAQLRLSGDLASRLELARPLIAAKLRNYATLADAWPSRPADNTAATLRELADRCAAALSPEELMGLEGAGAARWYATLPGRLPRGWTFERRVAPDAADPVNVLLNIAQTALHRWALLAVRAAGLLAGLGVLHRPRAGHAALASDLQEPFRHVMERAVLELTARLRPADFRRNAQGPFALSLTPAAQRETTATVVRALRRGVAGRGGGEARSYRGHLFGLARSLRRRLTDPPATWNVFEHPT